MKAKFNALMLIIKKKQHSAYLYSSVCRVGLLLLILTHSITNGQEPDDDVTLESDVAVESNQALINRLGDVNPEVSQPAIPELVQRGRLAVPDIIRNLRASAVYVPREAVDTALQVNLCNVLGEIGGEAEEAVPVLIRLTSEENLQVRYAAATALARIGIKSDEVLPAVLKVFDDPEVRAYYNNSLPEMDVFILNTSIHNLEKDDPEARIEAADSLGKLGVSARSSIPYLVKTLNDSNALVRDVAAKSLAKIASALQDARDIDATDQLKGVYEALATHSDPGVREQGETVRRAVVYLEVVKQGFTIDRLISFVRRYPLGVGIVIIYLFLLILWLSLLRVKPLWILRINNKIKGLADYTLPSWLGGIKIPLPYAILVGFFHYHPRVLDAWVESNLSSVREGFLKKNTVQERAVHIPVPVIIDGKNSAQLTSQNLQPIFAKEKIRLLIWGEGGAGKTSLACQIAKFAMAEDKSTRLCDHKMIPILIERELDIDVQGNQDAFTTSVLGHLQALVGEIKPIDNELLEHLMLRRRVLVILDHFSEMTDETRKKVRPSIPKFLAHALVVTSRIEEHLEEVPKTTIKPMRITGNRLSSFMEAYLSLRGKRDLFDDPEYFDACRQLSLIVGERDITVLLAKLYAEQMISLKETQMQNELPQSIPELMLRYVNELNRNLVGGQYSDREIQRVSKIVAWQCLKTIYRPIPTTRADIINSLNGTTDAEEILTYLEHRLKLIQTQGAALNKIRFTLDPLAEYLASVYLVEKYGDDDNLWRNFLTKAKQLNAEVGITAGFLLAVRDCCLAYATDINVPKFVTSEITHLLSVLTANKQGQEQRTSNQESSSPTVNLRG